MDIPVDVKMFLRNELIPVLHDLKECAEEDLRVAIEYSDVSMADTASGRLAAHETVLKFVFDYLDGSVYHD